MKQDTVNNSDADELAKFAALAAHWWDPKGDLKTLHQINPVRLGFITNNKDLSGLHVIDVGCGGGILSEQLARQGAKVTGIDLNQSLITVAKLHQYESHTDVEYLKVSAEEMAAERPLQYDIVTCLELLEHVPDPLSIIRACAKLAKPGGRIYLSTVNRNPKAYLYAILGAEYIFKLLPKNTHDYAKFIKPSELSAWLRECGLQPAEIKGIGYNPLTEQAKIIDDVSVNYIMRADKP